MRNLPSNPKDLTTALTAGLDSAMEQTERDAGEMGHILKMTKSGEWMYGADEIDVEEGSLWAVNPVSIELGYVNWPKVTGEPPEEFMRSIGDTPVSAGELPHIENAKGWQRQMAVQLMCVSGEDEGVTVRYSVSSKGGLKALRGLVDAIRREIAKDNGKFVPVVKLDSDHYKHKEYGRIYTPVFDVQKYVAMDTYPIAGEPAADEPEALEADEPETVQPEAVEHDEPETVEEPEEKPKRRRRRSAS